jgi:tetratricopeptide (TPR) repeat protein
MQNLLFVALLGLAVWGRWTDEREAVLSKARAHKNRYERAEALKLYQQVLTLSPDHAEALCNVAVLSVIEAHWRKHPQPKAIAEKALIQAQKALKSYPDNAECHFAMAVVLGELQQNTGSSQQRLRFGQQVYDHIQKALKLNPRHPESWSVLAAWHFKMGTLNAFERMAAGEVAKPASLTEGLKAIQNAIEYRPNNVKFYLLAARFYDELNRPNERNSFLKKALSLRPLAYEDVEIQEDCRILLKKNS